MMYCTNFLYSSKSTVMDPSSSLYYSCGDSCFRDTLLINSDLNVSTWVYVALNFISWSLLSLRNCSFSRCNVLEESRIPSHSSWSLIVCALRSIRFSLWSDEYIDILLIQNLALERRLILELFIHVHNFCSIRFIHTRGYLNVFMIVDVCMTNASYSNFCVLKNITLIVQILVLISSHHLDLSQLLRHDQSTDGESYTYFNSLLSSHIVWDYATHSFINWYSCELMIYVWTYTSVRWLADRSPPTSLGYHSPSPERLTSLSLTHPTPHIGQSSPTYQISSPYYIESRVFGTSIFAPLDEYPTCSLIFSSEPRCLDPALRFTSEAPQFHASMWPPWYSKSSWLEHYHSTVTT